MSGTDFWQFLAGVGIFLYGISQMEVALSQIAGRTFKLFLRKHTDHKISAIFSGAIVTGVLQSSSVVTLVVLSFVGAGVISMRNALAVVFGSNLGTTLDSWVVATIGFKFNIEGLSYPIIGISGLGLIVFSQRKRIQQISNVCMGFGLLFLGLGFMKESMYVFVMNFDFTSYVHLHKLGFVAIGFLITAMIQSSSATMVIVLSALNAGVFPFESAIALVIGSELGTTVKIIIGSIGGQVAKKRVAYGNFIFNIVITVFAYIFTYPLILLIKNVFGIQDHLIGLVMIQTVINMFGILLFLPFLKQFGDFLEKWIKEKKKKSTYFIEETNPLLPVVHLEAFEKEIVLFIHRTIHLNLEAFNIDTIDFKNEYYQSEIFEKNNKSLESYIEKYNNVKQAEGEILSFYSKMSEEKIEKNDFIRLNQLVSSLKNAMYSAKSIKDIHHDRKDLRESVVDGLYEHYQLLQTQLFHFYNRLNDLFSGADNKQAHFKILVKLMEQIQHDYHTGIEDIYRKSENDTLDKFDISTLVNMSREIYSSNKALIFSLKDYYLDPKLSEKFEEIPVTI